MANSFWKKRFYREEPRVTKFIFLKTAKQQKIVMKEITAVNWLVIFNLLTGNILDSFRTLHQTVISAGTSR
jgi:hypothetical protein